MTLEGVTELVEPGVKDPVTKIRVFSRVATVDSLLIALHLPTRTQCIQLLRVRDQCFQVAAP